jgi:hypothetical protein
LSEFTQLDEHLYRNLDLLNGQVSALLDTLGRLEEIDTNQGGHKKRLFQLRKKKSTVSTVSSSSGSKANSGSSDRASPVMAATASSHELDADQSAAGSLVGMTSLSNSNQSLNTLGSSVGVTASASCRPTSFPGGDLTMMRSALRVHPPDSNGAWGMVSSSTKEEVIQQVHDMQAELASMTQTYMRHRDQLKQLIDAESKTASLQPQVAMIASLRQSLNAAMQQNTQLRTRLARIHAESDLGETPILATTAAATTEFGCGSLMRGMNNSLSYSSSCISEFFDAREYADSAGDTDDDVSDTDFSDTAGESGADEDEDDAIFLEPAVSVRSELTGGEKAGGGGGGTMVLTGRRRTLPVPKTDTEGVNLWNLLCKNIGKRLHCT